MRRHFVACCLVVCLLATPAMADSEEAAERKAQKMYKSAFRKWLTPEQRVAIMQNVARDYESTRWGDDALWILARVADFHNKPARSILLRQQLLRSKKNPRLEELTRERELFRSSRLREVEFLLEQTGHAYRGKAEKVRKVNVLPLVLHEQLGKAYHSLDMPSSALREYTRARQLAPPEGVLRKAYDRRIEKLRKDVRRQRKSTAGGQARKKSNAKPSKKPKQAEPQKPMGKAEENS